MRMRGISQIRIPAPSPAGGDDREPGAYGRRVARGRRGRGADRHESRRVEQAEHEEREAERADPGRAARIAPHDRDADDVVEAAGKRGARDGRRSVGGGERDRPRPLGGVEEPMPSPGLEAGRRGRRGARRTATSCGSAFCSGQPVDAKCRAASAEIPSASSVTTTLKMRFPRGVRSASRILLTGGGIDLGARDPDARTGDGPDSLGGRSVTGCPCARCG